MVDDFLTTKQPVDRRELSGENQGQIPSCRSDGGSSISARRDRAHLQGLDRFIGSLSACALTPALAEAIACQVRMSWTLSRSLRVAAVRGDGRQAAAIACAAGAFDPAHFALRALFAIGDGALHPLDETSVHRKEPCA